MICPRCGTSVPSYVSYCPQCRARVGGPAVMAVSMERPAPVTVLAVLQFIGGAACLLLAAVLAVVVFGGRAQADEIAFGSGFLVGLLGMAAFQIVCGIGLWRLRSYGRIMQLISAGIGLLGIPVGTLISIVILVYLLKPGIKLLFSDRDAATFTPDEAAAVQKVTSGGSGTVIVVVALGLFLVFVVGIIAAIALPGLLRARIAGNEASAIGALLAISSAETSYSASNGGYYDSQACLVKPAGCLPEYRGSEFLQEELRQRSGYVFTLGGTPAPPERAATTSRTSLEHFTMVAAPITPQATGTRTFCVDDSGVVRWMSARVVVPELSGACPASWPPVR
jgi:type II secretory pathway pseudopilin PulG